MGRRRYTADFKRRVVVEAMRGDQTVQAIAARHGINPNQLSRWKTEAYDGLLEVFGDGKRIAQTISVVQLFRMFPDEEACYTWLEDARWEGRPICPHCGGIENISRPPSKPRTYWHKDCRKQFTVTTGTCMHATKRPLQDWIFAIYGVLTARKGVSALQLSKELGEQYRTAWHMLRRVREACGRGDSKLTNVVEADETYIGGKESNKHESKKLHAGRGAVGKAAVAGIRERGGKVKAKPVERVDAANLVGFVADAVWNPARPSTPTMPPPTARCRPFSTSSSTTRWPTARASTCGARSTPTGSSRYGPCSSGRSTGRGTTSPRSISGATSTRPLSGSTRATAKWTPSTA